MNRGSKKDARAGGSDPAEALEDSLNNRLEAPFVEEEWDEKWSNDKVNSRDREGEAKTIELAQVRFNPIKFDIFVDRGPRKPEPEPEPAPGPAPAR